MHLRSVSVDTEQFHIVSPAQVRCRGAPGGVAGVHSETSIPASAACGDDHTAMVPSSHGTQGASDTDKLVCRADTGSGAWLPCQEAVHEASCVCSGVAVTLENARVS